MISLSNQIILILIRLHLSTFLFIYFFNKSESSVLVCFKMSDISLCETFKIQIKTKTLYLDTRWRCSSLFLIKLPFKKTKKTNKNNFRFSAGVKYKPFGKSLERLVFI